MVLAIQHDDFESVVTSEVGCTEQGLMRDGCFSSEKETLISEFCDVA